MIFASECFKNQFDPLPISKKQFGSEKPENSQHSICNDADSQITLTTHVFLKE